MDKTKILFQKAAAARLNAYAPYSKFLVGTCIETKNGDLFTGCNVENASYNLGMCAEASAIAAMVTAGEKEIKEMMVVVQGPGISTCCGACRQRLYEFSTPDTLIHLADLSGSHQTYRLNELLPHAFGPKDLAPKTRQTT